MRVSNRSAAAALLTLETADWSRFPRRVTTNEHFSSQITYLSVRINFEWQFSDVYKRLFLCPRQVKRGCHVTCPSLLFNSLLAFWVLSEGILKTLVFWGYPKLGDRHCLFLALENCAYLGMDHDCRQISVHISRQIKAVVFIILRIILQREGKY